MNELSTRTDRLREAGNVKPVMVPFDLFSGLCVRLKLCSEEVLKTAQALTRVPPGVADDAQGDILNALIRLNQRLDEVEAIYRGCLDEHAGKPMPEEKKS